MRKKSPREARESTLASGWTVEEDAPATPEPESPAVPGAAAASEARPGSDSEPEPAGPQQMSNGALVLMGVIGGIYLLYTYVWMTWAQYYAGVNTAVAANSGVIGGVLQQIVFWAAPVAPALWFLSAVLLNRGRSTRRLAVALIAGAILLVPLPMLMSSGGAL